MSGFVAISRKLFDHYLWTKRREFSEAEAWLDLIQAANWQPGRQRVKGKTFEVGRGQLLSANRYLMERWGWKSLTKVQSFLRMLSDDGMIRSEALIVTSRISICNYETYNSLEVANKSQISRSEVAERSLGGRSEVAFEVKSNNKQEEKEKQEEQPPTAAGGFDFEKLARKVGRTCAKLMTEGGVGSLLPADKKPLLLKWLGYRHEKAKAVTTTIELHEVVKTWQANDAAAIEAAISKSVAAGWTTLVFEAAKDTAPPLPDYWKPGIEAELKMTPETAVKYYQHLISKGWYKTTEQGRPYWNRPESKNGSRTGETTMATALKN